MFHSILYFFSIANLLCLSYVDALMEIPQDHHFMLEHQAYRILGIGESCMDLLISVDEDFLSYVPGEKGGSQPIGEEELNALLARSHVTPEIAPGGSCANAIKGLAGLGERCAFLSRVGSDSLGDHFIRGMTRYGIMGLFSKSPRSTDRVLCLITPDGQRTMRFCSGCSRELTEAMLNPDYFKGVELVHFEAYCLRNGHLAKRAMQMAKNAQAKISFDLSSFEIVRAYQSTIIDLLSHYVDIVFANEDETKALTGLAPLEGCFKLQELCPLAVVLMGEEGCLVGHRGEILHSPAFPTHLVDSTGGGDLFASGFLYGYLRGCSLAKCARLGNLLGSAIIQVPGAELPLDKWPAMRAIFFKELND